jgi:hypothetical protein
VKTDVAVHLDAYITDGEEGVEWNVLFMYWLNKYACQL